MAWRQAIIWTNADPVHWHIYAALGGDELTHSGLDLVLIASASGLSSIQWHITWIKVNFSSVRGL